MSDAPIDYRDRLNIREQIARIDRAHAEIEKLLAETTKFRAEATKFRRERWIVPVTVAGALLAAIVARLPEILHAVGVGP